MDWFYDVFGFAEQGMSSIQQNITKDGMFLTCHAKGDTRVQCGRLDVPTLQKLREDTKEFVHKNAHYDVGDRNHSSKNEFTSNMYT